VQLTCTMYNVTYLLLIVHSWVSLLLYQATTVQFLSDTRTLYMLLTVTLLKAVLDSRFPVLCALFQIRQFILLGVMIVIFPLTIVHSR
jgi:fatty acid desaturase